MRIQKCSGNLILFLQDLIKIIVIILLKGLINVKIIRVICLNTCIIINQHYIDNLLLICADSFDGIKYYIPYNFSKKIVLFIVSLFGIDQR